VLEQLHLHAANDRRTCANNGRSSRARPRSSGRRWQRVEFHRPGRADGEEHGESFNRRLCEECLNAPCELNHPRLYLRKQSLTRKSVRGCVGGSWNGHMRTRLWHCHCGSSSSARLRGATFDKVLLSFPLTYSTEIPADRTAPSIS